jgi:hypothetical protein
MDELTAMKVEKSLDMIHRALRARDIEAAIIDDFRTSAHQMRDRLTRLQFIDPITAARVGPGSHRLPGSLKLALQNKREQ